MAKEKRERTDDDYMRLDEAINALEDWAVEIEEELLQRGYSKRYLSETLGAARRVHSPEE